MKSIYPSMMPGIFTNRFARWLLVATTIATVGGCAIFLVPPPRDAVDIWVYSEVYQDPTEIAEDYALNPVVTISPAINGQSVFVGDGAGHIFIENVPPGDYTIDPAFLDASHDVTFTMEEGGFAEPTIVLPRTGIYTYLVNLNSSNSDLQNATVRDALGVGIDRQALIGSYFTTDPPAAAFSLIPSIMQFDGAEAVAEVTESTTEAENLLSGAGVTNLNFTLLFNDSEKHNTIATAYKTQIEALNGAGTVTLETVEWSVFTDRVFQNADFELARFGWVMDANNVLDYLLLLADLSGYGSATLDTLETEARDALINDDIATHTAKVVAIHDLLLDETIAVPVYYE